jgi:benzoyl-CoA 2,3-dioxygenase component B
MSSIDYTDKIPNNVNLSQDRTLQRALEHWQPEFIDWWKDTGPEGSNGYDVYLRTAISVDPGGWAQFGHVKMPDYRWGIFLNPAEQDRRIHFGDNLGQAAWQDVPGEHRANLRRIIVTQGDTEPASVEQQRHLGPDRAQHVRPAQPVPDQRRGRPPPVGDGLPAAEALRPRRPRGSRGAARAPLGRRGQPAHPGRLQREDARLAERSSCSPTSPTATASSSCRAVRRARSTRWRAPTKFMLTEEAHHMFVGESACRA